MGDKICMVRYHRQRQYFARVRLRKCMAVFPMFLKIPLNQISLFSNPIPLSLHKHLLSLIPPFFLLVLQARNLWYLWLFPSIHKYFLLGNTTILQNGLSVLYFCLPDLTSRIIPSSTAARFLCPPRFINHQQTSKENFLLPHSDTKGMGVSTPAILHFSEHQLGVL